MSEPELTGTNTPERAKKKKKTNKKRSQSDSPAVSTENQAPTYILPVQPDEWYIQPGTFNQEGVQITEEQFIFYKNSQAIVTLDFNADNFLSLTQILHNRFLETDYTPDNWTIKQPLSQDNPIMSLTKNGFVLAATELDQKALKAMVKALNSHIIKPPTLTKHFSTWWSKHKILRVFLTLALIPVALLILYSFVWGIQN